MKTRLAIIDWGIGGISIYRLIKQDLGDIPVTYFSDTGVTPYGKMTRPALIERLNTIIGFLASRGVTHLIIGCNAASTVIPFLAYGDLELQGVIEPAAAFTADLRPADLGLIGGRRTIVSGVYRRAFCAKGIGVRQRIAQPISGLIESGDTSSEILRETAGRILRPLRNCSHILLACTHYPAIVPLLSEFVSPQTEFIDPASQMVKIVKTWKLLDGGDDLFLTSGNADLMERSAQNAFGVSTGPVSHMTI